MLLEQLHCPDTNGLQQSAAVQQPFLLSASDAYAHYYDGGGLCQEDKDDDDGEQLPSGGGHGPLGVMGQPSEELANNSRFMAIQVRAHTQAGRQARGGGVRPGLCVHVSLTTWGCLPACLSVCDCYDVLVQGLRLLIKQRPLALQPFVEVLMGRLLDCAADRYRVSRGRQAGRPVLPSRPRLRLTLLPSRLAGGGDR